ncbi:MAG TPA: hypothetical protein VF423_16805, partial [Actinomycetes bacterium]
MRRPSTRPIRVATAVGALATAALTALATTGPPAAAAAAGTSDALARYIVVLEEGTDAASVAAEHASSLGVVTGHVYSSALDGYAARMPAAVAGLVEA